jgi:hypothetical protein
MFRLRWVLVSCAVTAACGVETDDRPLEVDYLTSAILAPSCAQAQCHSSFARKADLAFDTPDHVRESLLQPGADALLSFDSGRYDPRPYEPSAKPHLITWITNIDPFAKGVGRMPFDTPLPDKDVALLAEWIREPDPARGITGARAVGAQCNPALYGGRACDRGDLVECGDDWNFGAVIESCSIGCYIRQGTDGAFTAECAQ